MQGCSSEIGRLTEILREANSKIFRDCKCINLLKSPCSAFTVKNPTGDRRFFILQIFQAAGAWQHPEFNSVILFGK